MSMCNLSIVLGDQGKFEEADEISSRALKACLETYEENHPVLTIEYTQPIPTVSTWGLIITAFLILIAGTIVSCSRKSVIL